MRDIYETSYGIYNHDNPDVNKPLALVAKQWSEDTTEESPLYEMIQKFADHNVSKYYGMSFNEFIELPRDVCEKIFEVSLNKLKEEGKMAQNVLNSVQQNKANSK